MTSIDHDPGAGSRRRLTGEEDFDGLTRAVPTLPGTAYVDPAHFERELERIF